MNLFKLNLSMVYNPDHSFSISPIESVPGNDGKGEKHENFKEMALPHGLYGSRKVLSTKKSTCPICDRIAQMISD
jgi:hypothetical protein